MVFGSPYKQVIGMVELLRTLADRFQGKEKQATGQTRLELRRSVTESLSHRTMTPTVSHRSSQD